MEIVDIRRQLARHPNKTYSQRSLEAIKYLAIHHSATTQGDGFSFARYHVNTRDWPEIAYHYVILKDGTIQWTNDLTTVSYHVKSYNTSSVGICLVGDFTREELPPAQKEVLIKLCQKLMTDLKLTPASIKGHDQLTGDTACPGLEMENLISSLSTSRLAIYLDGQPLDITAQLQDGVTYVPLRALSTALGFEVTWEESTRSIFIKSKENCQEIEGQRNDFYRRLTEIKAIVGEV